jgi:hypothetical protein
LKRFAGRKNSLVTIRNPEDNKMLHLEIMRVITQQLASKGILEDSANQVRIPMKVIRVPG